MLKMLGGFKISSSMMELDICKHIYLNTPHLGDLLVLSFFGFLIFLYLSVESNVSIAPPPVPWTDPAADVCTAAHGVVFSAASESRDMAKAVENSGFSAIYSLSFHTTLLLVHGFLVPAVFWPAKYLTGGDHERFRGFINWSHWRPVTSRYKPYQTYQTWKFLLQPMLTKKARHLKRKNILKFSKILFVVLASWAKTLPYVLKHNNPTYHSVRSPPQPRLLPARLPSVSRHVPFKVASWRGRECQQSRSGGWIGWIYLDTVCNIFWRLKIERNHRKLTGNIMYSLQLNPLKNSHTSGHSDFSIHLQSSQYENKYEICNDSTPPPKTTKATATTKKHHWTNRSLTILVLVR